MAALELLALNESTPQIVAPQAGDTLVAPITLQAATGNEVALTLNYTTNKATSGNDTGLVINQTDTASPGTSLLADFQVGSTSLTSVNNAGQLWLDKAGANNIANSLVFGSSANTGVMGNGTLLQFHVGGTSRFVVSSSALRGFSGGGGLVNGTVSATAPGLTANYSDTDTGLGSGGADQLSLIAGGVEGIRITETGSVAQVEINQGTNDAPFIDFQATADGDSTSAISTLTTSGSTTHHIQVEINGTKAWIAASTNAPS